MSSNYFVKYPGRKTGKEETLMYDGDDLASALGAFLRLIQDGAESVELRWSA